MAWIESHQALKDHPKTLALCRHLGAERPQVVGHLHLLWWWCIDYAIDGNLSKFSQEQIAFAAEWRGNPAKFFEALVLSGFLDANGNRVEIHDWAGYCGSLIERRLKRLAAKRPRMVAERPPTNHTNHTNPTNQSTWFFEFWKEYPKRVGKGAAERIWKRLHPDSTLVEKIMSALKAQKVSAAWIKENGQFIPNPATWLNQRRWEDEVSNPTQESNVCLQ